MTWFFTFFSGLRGGRSSHIFLGDALPVRRKASTHSSFVLTIYSTWRTSAAAGYPRGEFFLSARTDRVNRKIYGKKRASVLKFLKNFWSGGRPAGVRGGRRACGETGRSVRGGRRACPVGPARKKFPKIYGERSYSTLFSKKTTKSRTK